MANKRSIAVTHIISVCKGQSHSCIFSFELKFYHLSSRGYDGWPDRRETHFFHATGTAVIAAGYKFSEPARLAYPVRTACTSDATTHLRHKRRRIWNSTHSALVWSWWQAFSFRFFLFFWCLSPTFSARDCTQTVGSFPLIQRFHLFSCTSKF